MSTTDRALELILDLQSAVAACAAETDAATRELARHRLVRKALLDYLTSCAIMRVEPNSHGLRTILSSHGFDDVAP